MLPITRVTLYTSGVGYFERGGEVEGDARLTLFFPVGQVNDVLKSLVLLDGGGGAIAPVTYAAQDPVFKALQAFSLDIGDNPDRATLLGRMRGVSVTLTTDNLAPLTGIISGVETQTVFLPEDQGTTERAWLTVLAGDALHTVPLDSVRSLQINDAALADELRQALAAVAQGRDAGKRPVTLAFNGEGRRAVQIGYLLEAPAWQTSYRLVLGETPRLQGWALVQNTGQDDWSDAHLSLVSGRPISFIQDLYTPLYVHRPTVQPRIPASPTPQTYASDMMAQDEGMEFALSAPMAAPPAPVADAHFRRRSAPAPMGGLAMDPGQAAKQSVATTGASLGAALFAYHIDVPVSVPRQQSAMIPFVAAPVEAERVSVYNSRVQADHPLTGIRLKNTTDLHLMGGPLTVFDTQDEGTAGYVGDALMDDTEAGQTRLLTYALDLAVDADIKPGRASSVITAFTIAKGVLRVSRKAREAVDYTFKNNGGTARTVVVEHLNREGQWALTEPVSPTERTASHYRFDVAVPAGRSVTFGVREERSYTDSFALVDANLEGLAVYANSPEATAPVQAALEEVAARRRRLADLEVRIADLDAQAQAIGKGQERIRNNMQSLDHKSDLYRRYVGELDRQETQIGALTADRVARQTEIASARADLSGYVAGLSL